MLQVLSDANRLPEDRYMQVLSSVPAKISAVLEFPPVQDLIRNGVKANDLEACLAVEIARTANMLTVGGNLRQGQSLEIAKILIADYPGESLQDFCLCLRLGLKEKWGQIFRFDIMVINGWMKSYLEEKYQAAEDQLKQERDNLYANIKPAPEPPALAYKRIEDYPCEYAPVKNKEARALLWQRRFYAMKHMRGRFVPKISDKEIREEGRQKPKSVMHPSAPMSIVIQREYHIRWIQANHDPYTGKPLPNWVPEDEWIKKQKES